MKILFISHYTEMLGANRSLLSLAQFFKKENTSVTVVVPSSGELNVALKKSDIASLVSPVPSQWADVSARPSKGTPLRRMRWRYSTRNYARQRSIDAAMSIQSKLTTPFDVVYSNSSASRVGVELANLMSVPHVWHLREFPENYGLEYAGGRREFTSLANRSAVCIAISKAVKNRLVPQSIIRLSKMPRCEVVYNGVATKAEIEQFQKKIKQCSTGKFRLLLIGHVFRSKGHELALSALSQLVRSRGLKPSEIELKIVGPGDFQWVNKLQKHYSVEEFSNVAGPTETPFDEIRAANCVLMCSHREAFGRVTAEAMALGTPVVAVDDQAGSAELVQDGVNGILCERTANALADAIWQLMANPLLATQLQAGGFCSAKTDFTVEAYGSKIKRIVSSLL